MKQIFPTDQNKINKLSADQKPVTEEQYKDLVNRVNESEEQSRIASDKVDQLLTDQQNQIATNQINATSGDIENLSAYDLNADHIISGHVDSTVVCAHDITASGNLCADNTVSNTGTISDLTSNTICSHDVNTDVINATSGRISNLEVNSLSLEAIESEGLTSENADICNLNAENADICNLNAENAEIQNAEINSLSVDQEKTTNAEVDYLDVNFITHTRNTQEVQETADSGDFFIVLPEFTNGWYYLEARNDTNRKLWSVEVLNSIKNIQFRWSESALEQIKNIKISTNASGVSIIQIAANSHNEHITLYEQSASTDNLLPPTIYTEDTLVDTPINLVITEYNGTYIQDVIFTNKLHVDCLEMDALFMDCVGVYRELWLTCKWDISGDIKKSIANCGTLNQYVSKRLVNNIETPTWTDPATRITTDCNNLTPTDVIARYDGSYLAETGDVDIIYENTVYDHYDTRTVDDEQRDYALIEYYVDDEGTKRLVDYRYDGNYYTVDGYTVPTSQGVLLRKEVPISDVHYPLIHIGDLSCVHGSIEVECNQTICCDLLVCNDTEVKGDFKSKHIGDESSIENGLQIDEDSTLSRKSTTEYEDDEGEIQTLERLDEIAVYNCDCKWEKYEDDEGNIVHPADSCLLIYNETTNAIEPTSEAKLNDLEVCNLHVLNCACIDCDVVIGHDLYVKGTTHTVDEETISTSSDIIILRQNSVSGLSQGEASGIVVRNGDKNVAIVADCDGTLRSGEVSGTEQIYPTIYFYNDKYYADLELTTEVTVSGDLTAWDSKTVITDDENRVIQKYVNAVFTVFSYTDISPVLHRDELANLTDNALLVWNCATLEADTISIPTTDKAVLKYRMGPPPEGIDILETRDVSGDVHCFCGVTKKGDFGCSYQMLTLTNTLEEEGYKPVAKEVECSLSYYDPNRESYMMVREDTLIEVVRFINTPRCATIGEYAFNYDEQTCCLNLNNPIQPSYHYNYPYPVSCDFPLTCCNQDLCFTICRYERGGDNGTYYWERDAGNYHFATMADYCAVCDDIPADSYITIDEVCNYTVSEDK